jgi:hypothetical protein
MAILKFLFQNSHLQFQIDVLLPFSAEVMSINDTLKIISNTYRDKCHLAVNALPSGALGLR